jgi:hypothetical protein
VSSPLVRAKSARRWASARRSSPVTALHSAPPHPFSIPPLQPPLPSISLCLASSWPPSNQGMRHLMGTQQHTCIIHYHGRSSLPHVQACHNSRHGHSVLLMLPSSSRHALVSPVPGRDGDPARMRWRAGQDTAVRGEKLTENHATDVVARHVRRCGKGVADGTPQSPHRDCLNGWDRKYAWQGSTQTMDFLMQRKKLVTNNLLAAPLAVPRCE